MGIVDRVKFPIIEIALTVAIATIVASVSYRFIERPAQRMIQRKEREYFQPRLAPASRQRGGKRPEAGHRATRFD
jgi:peptidoglycan/LPS O-acetylase OafA/YrhL